MSQSVRRYGAGVVSAAPKRDRLTATRSPKAVVLTVLALLLAAFVAPVTAAGPAAATEVLSWTSRTSAADNVWTSVTYAKDPGSAKQSVKNGLFVAVSDNQAGADADRVMTSPDGITWTSQAAAVDEAWQSVAYGNGKFVAVSPAQ